MHAPLRRTGIGSTLLNAVETSGGVLWLSVWARNPHAIAFYRTRGYRDVGRTEHRIDGVAYANRVFVGPHEANDR